MSSPTAQAWLDELSDRFGIVSDYHDIFGRRHVTSADTKRAILGAMGVKVETEEDVARELAASQDAAWRIPCDPVLVCRMEEEQAKTWSFRMPAKADEDQVLRIEWTIQDENGGCRVSGRSRAEPHSSGNTCHQQRTLCSVRTSAPDRIGDRLLRSHRNRVGSLAACRR